MNKKSFLFLLAIAGVILFSVIALPITPLFKKSENPPPLLTHTQTPTITTENITLYLHYGKGNIQTFETSATKGTVYNLLKMIAIENDIELKSKSYDFGILIESIGGYENTNERAWIYFVNGESGQVAADKMELKKGDLVEWKYITPSE